MVGTSITCLTLPWNDFRQFHPNSGRIQGALYVVDSQMPAGAVLIRRSEDPLEIFQVARDRSGRRRFSSFRTVDPPSQERF